ncbi:hypothetical protein H0H92_010535 [Tricholoma furcatifolium]|nr:hypothetical protein H0H92_010535 [Tricholoma furcatifolium]
MPAPFALLQRPSGDWNDVFDRIAMHVTWFWYAYHADPSSYSEMSIAHNMFIRGINAVYAHAPNIEKHQVKGFMFFCNALLTLIHHHHTLEEELQFPAFESKLGANAMGHNVDQHHSFNEGLEDLERYIKEVQEGKVVYDADLVLKKLDSFADALVQHLHDGFVAQELPTIESSKLRAVFKEQELKDINAQMEKMILKEVSLVKDLPLGLILHDKTTAPE